MPNRDEWTRRSRQAPSGEEPEVPAAEPGDFRQRYVRGVGLDEQIAELESSFAESPLTEGAKLESAVATPVDMLLHSLTPKPVRDLAVRRLIRGAKGSFAFFLTLVVLSVCFDLLALATASYWTVAFVILSGICLAFAFGLVGRHD